MCQTLFIYIIISNPYENPVGLVLLSFFFFLVLFGRLMAYEVLGLGIRSELKLQPMSCSNTRFLNHYARPGIELVSQCSRDVADPTAPQQDL